MRWFFLLLAVLLFRLDGLVFAQEDSSQKERILSARQTAREADKNRRDCDKLGFPASAADNRCFTFYPSFLMTFGKGFNEGLAKVTLKGKAGFVNTSGELVIPAKFNEAGSFSDGLAPFETSNGKWGFIDKLGNIAIKPRFDWALDFREGLAAVQIGEKWGFIDRRGQIKISPKYDEVSSFAEGLASVTWLDKTLASSTFPKGKWRNSFIDPEGTVKIEGSFQSINRAFERGIALVSQPVDCSFRACTETYAIDKTGTRLWTLDSWYISWFSDDVIVVAAGKDSDGRDQFQAIGRDGKPIFENRRFSHIGAFVDGLAPARRTWTGKYGYIDKRGEFVIEENYQHAGPFSQGLAAVESGWKYGYIDKTGRILIDPEFAFADTFQEGFALVAPTGPDKETTGYIDRSGKYIWKPTK